MKAREHMQHQKTHLDTSESITKHKQNARFYLAQYMFINNYKSKNTKIFTQFLRNTSETSSGNHE
jgi:hypothetical protein